MSTVEVTQIAEVESRRVRFSLPQPLWLIIFSLGIGLAGGLKYSDLVHTFGSGYGKALGDFTLILLPSFILAACLSRQPLHGASSLAVAIAPVTAAGMICPDTGYATLASIADRRKLSVAFGSFAGFRLLFPAGPLIIATGLGVDSHALFLFGVILMIPIWIVGEVWARHRANAFLPKISSIEAQPQKSVFLSRSDARALMPLFVLGALLVIGGLFNLKAYAVLDFISHPKGALFVAAALALVVTNPENRRECVDTSMRRTGWMLIVIGAASAFGGMISHFVSLDQLLPATTSPAGVIIALFLMSMVIKIIYGSALATFATAAALLAPIVHASTISPIAAVFAICLGSFAILPTDSYYWLVRSDALSQCSERSSLITMSGGVALQGVVGFVILLCMYMAGLV